MGVKKGYFFSKMGKKKAKKNEKEKCKSKPHHNCVKESYLKLTQPPQISEMIPFLFWSGGSNTCMIADTYVRFLHVFVRWCRHGSGFGLFASSQCVPYAIKRHIFLLVK